ITYMCFDRMQELAGLLANAIQKVSQPRNAVWGRDFTLLITTDAVHYGDEDWGGKNFARYGTDSSGYQQAIEHEYEIISNCLTGQVDPEKMKRFNQYTVEDDCKTYKWTWCGRFSIPLGLLTANNLQMLSGDQNLTGTFLGYANSIDHPRLEVEDIGLGFTAPAHLRHWVGYVAVGYR
nr:AmmeMemoRadiSam system protein B [Bacteroidota bacterium]